MMKTFKILILLTICCFIHCSAQTGSLPIKKLSAPVNNLYEVFQNPSTKYRPFIRWWWNGSRINEKEIIRELDLMKQIGIGGVEINTISFPESGDSLNYAAVPVLSDEWIRLINVAADACKERGMVCDLIVGSGWPFGAEFLKQEEQIEMLSVETIDIKGNTQFSISTDELLTKVEPHIWSKNPTYNKELLYLRLMPKHIETFTEGISYDVQASNKNITIDVPQGEHVLYCFVKLTGYMKVIEGAPGASGPVVNHFDSKAVNRFLNSFSDKMNFKNGKLKGKIRAAFTDSFELEGANWDDNMLNEFEKRFGYSLSPYLPYIIRKVGGMGEPLADDYGSTFSKQVKEDVINRVRNDFEHAQIDLFYENFIDTFNKWCHRNGIKSRVQAYGRQLHQLESAMYIDLPESETWVQPGIGVRLGEKDSNFSSGRAYTPINKFVSSGAFLSGNNIVSCEEVTNVSGIFSTTLEELKITGDRSNLSGVNQSVLHGFNYSPPQDDFLGWIKFGTYFSEKNTWWPYLKFWLDYKARISSVLQNSTLQADIAILSPLEDLWSKHGQQREPFPVIVEPNYVNNVWEAVHQNGNGCDYVSEKVIQQAKMTKGCLSFGSRSYKTLLMIEVESMDPQTARAIELFVNEGGKVISIGKTPSQSIGFKNAAARDLQVKTIMDNLKTKYPNRFITVVAPEGSVREWYSDLQKQYDITPFVKIDKPNDFLLQNYYKSGNKDLFFIINTNMDQEQNVHIEFPDNVKNKQAWIWDAESGERYKINTTDNSYDLHVGQSESKLIVFDNETEGKMLPPEYTRNTSPMILDGKWVVKAVHHVEKKEQIFDIVELVDFNSLPFPWLKNFTGTLEYSRHINVENPAQFARLDAGLTYNGITELFVNGKSVGIKWYGERVFEIKDKLKKGDNIITIKVTTLMNNYVKSRILDTPTAQRWDWAINFNHPMGLRGPVALY